MNAKEFIKAWREGRSFVNSKLNGDIMRTENHWAMHINAEIIVFFDDVKDSMNDVVLLMDGDHATPFCTFSWRVVE